MVPSRGSEQLSFLLAEQNTSIALRYATYGYILDYERRKRWLA